MVAGYGVIAKRRLGYAIFFRRFEVEIHNFKIGSGNVDFAKQHLSEAAPTSAPDADTAVEAFALEDELEGAPVAAKM